MVSAVSVACSAAINPRQQLTESLRPSLLFPAPDKINLLLQRQLIQHFFCLLL